MTYNSALEWANNNIPKDEYDTFEEWYDKLTEKFNTPELTDNDVFQDLAKDEWISEIGALDKSDLEQPIEQEEIPIPSRVEEVSIGSPRIITVPKEALNPEKENIIVLPKTDKAPITIRPVIILPQEIKEIPKPQKQSFFSRLKSFFSFRRRK